MKTLYIIKVTFLLILCLVANSFHTVWADEIAYYEPYPIVFIHGYNNVGVEHGKLWATTVNNFKKYFNDDKGDSKYFTDYEYYQVFDYTEASNGDIDIAADWLKGYIDYVLKNIPKYQKEEERKVIIVAHSSGGLVTKRFLAKYPDYKNKIKRAVFIGTPHSGSPLASGLILMDRLKPELERMKESDRAGLRRMSYGTVEENEQYVAYLERYNAISNALDWYEEVVKFNVWPLTIGNMFAGHGNRYNPNSSHNEGQGVALGQLVVPETMTGSKTFTGTCLWKGKVVAKAPPLTTEPAFYEKGDTFINNRNFELPSDYKIIMGQGSLMADILGTSATVLIKNSIDLSGFPAGNTLEDLDRGDGIVTPASQTAIGGEVITVNRSHITETDAWQTILLALDDPPEIVSAYAIPVDWNKTYALRKCDYYGRILSYDSENSWYYLIFKLKDYLLADIEVEKLNLITGTETIDLLEGRDSYKPYLEFGKHFLRERVYSGVEIEKIVYKDIEDNDRCLKLMPGEFCVKTKIPLNAQSVYIKIKNPAEFTAERTFSITRPVITDIVWKNSLFDNDPYVYWRSFTLNVIDIAPHDYQLIEDGGYVRGCASRDNEGINLSFKIQESPYSRVKLNIWLCDYSYEWDHANVHPREAPYYDWTTIWKKFKTNQELNLTGFGASYSGTFDDFLTWHGEIDKGGKIPALDDYALLYRIKITAESVEDESSRKDDILSLLGSSGDVSYYYRQHRQEDIVGADPTFIQASRREGISW